VSSSSIRRSLPSPKVGDVYSLPIDKHSFMVLGAPELCFWTGESTSDEDSDEFIPKETPLVVLVIKELSNTRTQHYCRYKVVLPTGQVAMMAFPPFLLKFLNEQKISG